MLAITYIGFPDHINELIIHVSMNVFNSAFMYYGLTHWGRVTHICVGKLTIIGSDNGLSPGRRQAIIWTNAGILLIGPLGTNFSENLIRIQTFSFTNIRLKTSSAKWRPFCLGLSVLIVMGMGSRKEAKLENVLCIYIVNSNLVQQSTFELQNYIELVISLWTMYDFELFWRYIWVVLISVKPFKWMDTNSFLISSLVVDIR